MTKPIILAPAGGFAAVTAAVRCGADAVYLGAKNFNARRNAENFDDLALPETVKFCHERGTKVFVTVNTLVLTQLCHVMPPKLSDARTPAP